MALRGQVTRIMPSDWPSVLLFSTRSRLWRSASDWPSEVRWLESWSSLSVEKRRWSIQLRWLPCRYRSDFLKNDLRGFGQVQVTHCTFLPQIYTSQQMWYNAYFVLKVQIESRFFELVNCRYQIRENRCSTKLLLFWRCHTSSRLYNLLFSCENRISWMVCNIMVTSKKLE